MQITLAAGNMEAECESILRSLPMWFALEEPLLQYVRDTSNLPTFIASDGGQSVGFLSLRQHSPQSYEINCIAVRAANRNHGCGRALVKAASDWAAAQGGAFLQVKTLAPSHPSTEYAQTRLFYERMGFVPLEVFPKLWSEAHPCLQMIKCLPKEP